MECKIFTCYHKNCLMLKNDIITPIHVGKELSKQELGLIGDNTGDNISSKNPYFCELTATYWIWKNVKADCVGLFHYRRYLNFKNNEKVEFIEHKDILTNYQIVKSKIQTLIKEYDVIVPQITAKINSSLYEYYKKEHIVSDLEVVLDVIKNLYPEQYDIACDFIKNNSQMYRCNIIVAKKEVFDLYAKWLFSILFEVEKNIHHDVINRSVYQQRVYGFLSERLMGVFLSVHKELKVKELPLLFIEDNKLKWRKYQFKKYKRKFLTAIGLGKKKWKL